MTLLAKCQRAGFLNTVNESHTPRGLPGVPSPSGMVFLLQKRWRVRFDPLRRDSHNQEFIIIIVIAVGSEIGLYGSKERLL